MLIQNEYYHTIWLSDNNQSVYIIDQRFLPYQFIIEKLECSEDVYDAIAEMHLRGAPLIGVAGAYGVYFACYEAKKQNDLNVIYKAVEYLKAARPTAVNLAFCVDFVYNVIKKETDFDLIIDLALKTANNLKNKEIEACRQIGIYGVDIIEKIHNKTQKPVQILTHCNAGWLACIDYGTATAPIYEAHSKGIPVHIWVDETRPRNQGARLTAFELLEQGVPHTVITDNAGGYLMQQGLVDIVIVGSDRTTANGDIANKIGTYLKALAAVDNNVPFYVALPTSTIDTNICSGNDIVIEQRHEDEIKYVEGYNGKEIIKILNTPKKSPIRNDGFDITPARLVTALITEKGICKPNKESIQKLFNN